MHDWWISFHVDQTILIGNYVFLRADGPCNQATPIVRVLCFVVVVTSCLSAVAAPFDVSFEHRLTFFMYNRTGLGPTPLSSTSLHHRCLPLQTLLILARSYLNDRNLDRPTFCLL